MQIIRAHREVGAIFAFDHIHVDNEIQGANNNNNNETRTSVPRNIFYKCGNQFGKNHLQSFSAKVKICSKCAKWGHFAEVCYPENFTYVGDRNDKEEKEEIETQSQETDKDPVAFAEFTSNNGWDEYKIDNFSVKAIWVVFEIKTQPMYQKMILSDTKLN